MKKAKIALTVVAFLAVVSGALAFKTNGLVPFFKEANGQCTVLIQIRYTLTNVTAENTVLGIYQTSLSVFSNPTPCPITFYRTAL